MTDPGVDAATLQQKIFDTSPVIREVCERIGKSGVISIGRAGDGSGAFLLAALTATLRRPILLITAGLDEAERARRDWATFLDGGVEDFPPWESLFEEDSEPDAEIFARRTAAVEALRSGAPTGIVAPMQALLQPVARSAAIDSDRRVMLRPRDIVPPRELARQLVEAGYRRFPQVSRPGDFSIRGGILDVFPREGAHPYRVDYFDDEIDSIRAVDLKTQRSGNEVGSVMLTLMPKADYFIRGFTGNEVTLFDRLPDNVLLAVANPHEVQEKCIGLLGQWAHRREQKLSEELWARAGKLTRIELDTLPPERGKQPILLPVGSADRFQGSLDRVVDELREEAARGTQIRVFFRQEAESERFQEILDEGSVGPNCVPQFGDLSRSFRWQEDDGAIFLAGGEVLGRSRAMTRRARRENRGRAVQSFLEFEPGDFIVHMGHGIGRYQGIKKLESGRRQGDHLILEFRDGVRVLVPAERIDLVQKYVGGNRVHPKLDKVGGVSWGKKKQRVVDAVHDLANEMLELQALRAQMEGTAFPEDNRWQEEFEAAFPFEPTQDQVDAMEAIRKDLQSNKPMDRLICGDVGYGKTELAMRAAFKTVQAGKQVAVLVPTTILAQQHLLSFRERMAEFPVRIEALSRLRSRREATEILQRTQEGEVDILIGTHRLLSNDVSMRDLGLIIIDEEQRFGVAHKEKLKQLRRLVEVMTLTATPIPRTLHMALLGVRDISSLQEAPQGRRAVHTEVCAFDEKRFREIILRELNRDGQVFFVHNRVKSIEHRKLDLERLVPEARMIFAHGQMDEHELEKRMKGFLNKEFNVLVSTTIIESGLDIPSANTMIIERADRFGLAELHQLRGRVGRGHHKAYTYLLLPEDKPVAGDAAQRLQAIEEYSSLGSGFQIAMRDLEIRGAGNILGREQSGHIATIGYDMYCRLLERAVADLKGTTYNEPPDVEIAIHGSARIPEEYVPSDSQRLRFYRTVATALELDDVVEVEETLQEQFGELPEETKALLRLQMLRIELGRCGAQKVYLEDGWMIVDGNRSAVEKEFSRRKWDVSRLPEGNVAVRPRKSVLKALTDVTAAVVAGQ